MIDEIDKRKEWGAAKIGIAMQCLEIIRYFPGSKLAVEAQKTIDKIHEDTLGHKRIGDPSASVRADRK